MLNTIMTTATIKHAGELKQLKFGNAALMRFERLGGDLSKFGEQPFTQAVSLVCAALALPGDPLDHADDLPPLTELIAVVKIALENSGLTGAATPGESDGAALGQ
jgi:hypothetical protein